MTIKITGPWHKGLAFDVHTLSSTYLGPDEHGHDQWDTTRSEMGELVYRLKYRSDQSTLPAIVGLLEKIKGIEKFDMIVPIPPTNPARRWQPVTQIAEALGKRHNVAAQTNILSKEAGGPELKSVQDPDERRELLQNNMFVVPETDLSGVKVLLVDDLYRSGATLSVATDLLYEAGAEKVSVLTMTKTRSNR